MYIYIHITVYMYIYINTCVCTYIPKYNQFKFSLYCVTCIYIYRADCLALNNQ